MSSLNVARALGAELLVARGHLKGLEMLANATRSGAGSYEAGAQTVRSGALQMLDQVIPVFQRASGREAQVVIGARVNHAYDALANLKTVRSSLENAQGIDPKLIGNADAIAGSLLSKLFAG